MTDQDKTSTQNEKPATQPNELRQEKPISDASSAPFKKDIELRRRIKEQHPTLMDEELDEHLAVWGE